MRARLIKDGLQRAAEFSDAKRMAQEYWDIFKHALTNERLENLLTGVYVDGWAGTHLGIRIAPTASKKTLEMEFSAPPWLPEPRVMVQALCGGKPQGNPLVFDRGTNGSLSLPIGPMGGAYEVRITPTFVPVRLDYGDDQRELSIVLQRCTIVHDHSDRIELFPETPTA